MKLLLVVDVQGSPKVNVERMDGQPLSSEERAGLAEYTAQVRRLHDAMLSEVIKAIHSADIVMLLEDIHLNSRTHPSVLHALGDRPHLISRKAVHDGSGAVIKALGWLWSKITIEVCGNLTGVCIKETVRGLRKELGKGKVRVLAEACFDRPWSEEVLELELREESPCL